MNRASRESCTPLAYASRGAVGCFCFSFPCESFAPFFGFGVNDSLLPADLVGATRNVARWFDSPVGAGA